MKVFKDVKFVSALKVSESLSCTNSTVFGFSPMAVVISCMWNCVELSDGKMWFPPLLNTRKMPSFKDIFAIDGGGGGEHPLTASLLTVWPF